MGKVVTKRNRKPPKPPKLVLEPHQVLIKPAVTEKAMFQATELNQYTFRVNMAATKVDIKKAVDACKLAGLVSLVCADSLEKAQQIAEFAPDCIAYEPPELIGGDVSVTTRPNVIKKIVALITKTNKKV